MKIEEQLNISLEWERVVASSWERNKRARSVLWGGNIVTLPSSCMKLDRWKQRHNIEKKKDTNSKNYVCIYISRCPMCVDHMVWHRNEWHTTQDRHTHNALDSLKIRTCFRQQQQQEKINHTIWKVLKKERMEMRNQIIKHSGKFKIEDNGPLHNRFRIFYKIWYFERRRRQISTLQVYTHTKTNTQLMR